MKKTYLGWRQVQPGKGDRNWPCIIEFLVHDQDGVGEMYVVYTISEDPFP